MPDLPPDYLDSIGGDQSATAGYGSDGYSYEPAPLSSQEKPGGPGLQGGLKMGLGAIGGIFNIFGAFAKHDAEWNALSLQAKEYDASAHMEDANAVASLRRGSVAVGKVRGKASDLARRQGMAYASEGIDTTTGTAASVIATTTAYGEADAQTVRANAMSEALGHRTVASRYRTQSKLAHQKQQQLDAELNSSIASSVLGIAGSFLGF